MICDKHHLLDINIVRSLHMFYVAASINSDSDIISSLHPRTSAPDSAFKSHVHAPFIFTIRSDRLQDGACTQHRN